MWQRARIIRYDRDPELIGCLVWTQGKPELLSARSRWNGQKLKKDMRITINVIPNKGFRRACIRMSRLELLPEFTENAPMLSWKEFLALKNER